MESIQTKLEFQTIATLPDRYSAEYLKELSEQLKLDNLIATAGFEEKDVHEKPRTKKCIEIDFCGHASNTLLGEFIGRTATDPEAIKYLEQARNNFDILFKPETLQELTSKNIYLKVRFCFAYLYSDFPVCLMKAEDPDNWKHLGEDYKYKFHISPPLSEDELINSTIYQSQKDSLRVISEIVKDNRELVIRGTEKHSIQVRFPVVPSPLCLLIVNNFAYCDPYLYAMLIEDKKKTGLSLHYPISIINKQNHKTQFESVRKHFKYLWRHDLTLFCGDATHFKIDSAEPKKDNIRGLQKIKPPYKVSWNDKENRIRNYYLEFERSHPDLKITEANVKKWRKNLNEKFKLSTTKVVLNKWDVLKYGSLINITDSIFSWFKLLIIVFIVLSIAQFVFPIDTQIIFHWILDHSLYTILGSLVYILSILISKVIEMFRSLK